MYKEIYIIHTACIHSCVYLVSSASISASFPAFALDSSSIIRSMDLSFICSPSTQVQGLPSSPSMKSTFFKSKPFNKINASNYAGTIQDK